MESILNSSSNLRTNTKLAHRSHQRKRRATLQRQGLQRYLCSLYFEIFAQFRLEQPPTPASATPNPTHPAFKTAHESGTIPPTLGATNPAEFYPAISATLNTTNPGAVQWAQTRPTLTGGIASGRMSGWLQRFSAFQVIQRPL